MTNTTDAARQADPLLASAANLRDFWNQATLWLAGHYLQILIAIGIGIAIVLILLGIRSFGLRLCARDAGFSHWPTTIGRAISLTHIWFMVAFAAKLVDGYAAPPRAVADTINIFFTIAAALQAAIWARELILGIVEHRAGDTDNGTLGSAIGIIRLLVTVVLFTIAGVLILDNLGVNVTGLIAGLGIGGIAIGLAAKGIFDDLFSALSIIFDKPFRRGDSVRWDSTSGTVEAIGLKTTRVRALTGEEVVISNTNLLNKELHNMARLARRRHVLTLGVTYQTPPEVCARIPTLAREIVEAHDKCKLVRCGMTNFNSSSLDFELQFDVMSEIYEEIFEARHKVCIAILKRFNAEGIDFAYPTQTSFTAAPDGRFVLPYAAETRPIHGHEQRGG
ncbi:mechanosensitive ion channel protein MscS [Sphingomonas oleivorans]|uniref:Mechanosensitive ion channel protein MscS n=1 Tax=Sphingomonas oleivorans TaxID=1735121 RepID=A0A2T5FVV6_9SPHN|nr:mechanosensitive ion channel domain-containing protein [Sphingomonas oleivorans]PTQ09911.1 mechanosensitive ion channel protein MscS [Sphingomonas oleivorans]